MTPTIDQLLRDALDHHRAGRFDQAASLYNKILALNPNEPRATNLLGVLASDQGRHDEGIDLMLRSIVALPNLAAFHNNLGEAYRKSNRAELAAAAYRRAIELDPRHAEARNNLGLVLLQLQQIPEAIDTLNAAIVINPQLASAHHALARAYLSKKQTLLALQAAQDAVNLKTNHAPYRATLAQALFDAGQIDNAATEARKAVALDPTHLDPHLTLAQVLFMQGEIGAAIQARRKAAELEPNTIELRSSLLSFLKYDPDYDGLGSLPEYTAYAQQLRRLHPSVSAALSVSVDPNRRLRLGYVSPDLRNHAVAFFVEPFLASHDKDQFELFIYSDAGKPDAVTHRLQSYTANWRDVTGSSHDEVESLIREDGIDLLVDLAVHTPANRLSVFVRRPAPVQFTYLGYPGTTGLSEIDHKITDALIDPPGLTESHHTERLLPSS